MKIPKYQEGTPNGGSFKFKTYDQMLEEAKQAQIASTPTRSKEVEYNNEGDYYEGGTPFSLTLTKTKPKENKSSWRWTTVSNPRMRQLTASDVMKAAHTAVNPILAFTSPSQYYGAFRDSKNVGDWFRSMMRGNSGFVTKEFEEKHPFISLGLNLAGDAAGTAAAIKYAPKIGEGVKRAWEAMPKVSLGKDNYINNKDASDLLRAIFSGENPNYTEMDKVMAYSQAKQRAYDIYSGPVWEQRMRNAGFSQREIQEAKDFYFRNIRNNQLLEEKGNIQGNELGSFSSKYGFPEPYNYLEGNVPKGETSLNLNGINDIEINSPYRNVLENTSNHEVIGHGANYNIMSIIRAVKQKGLSDDKYNQYFSRFAGNNPTVTKIFNHNASLYPRINPGTNTYFRNAEEVRARVVAAREHIAKVLRQRYPVMEQTDPLQFEEKVNSAFRSMINKGKNHNNKNIQEILWYYDPTDIQIYNERFLKKGGNIKIK